MRPENTIADQESTPMCAEAAPRGPNVLDRLRNRRHRLHQELRRIENTIQFLEKNQAMVEVVEVVLLAQGKCDDVPPPGLGRY